MKQTKRHSIGCLMVSLALLSIATMGCASNAWGIEPDQEGIRLEKNAVHFKMASCPICEANPAFQGHLDHAYHSNPVMASITCKVVPEDLSKKLTYVGFEGEGVVNDQVSILGTLTAYGPEATLSDCIRLTPHVLGVQNVAVQAYTGSWGNLQKAGRPAQLTLTTSTLPSASLEATSNTIGITGAVIDVLGDSETATSFLKMNEAATIISKNHPQMILSVASSDSSVAKVEQIAFASEMAPDGNPYMGYRIRCMHSGCATISIKDALGANHSLSLNVVDEISQSISLANASVTVKSKAWTGKSQKCAAPTVKIGGKTLRNGVDFTYTCKAGKAVGSYKVTITGKGAYTGTKTATFKIVPKGTSVSKLTKARKAFTVKWKKPSKAALKQTTGYQVRWSTAKSMKGAKSKTVKAASATGKKCQLKVAKLKAGKKYYVQVRTYKKVGKATYYSSWSKAKAVTTRK